ncbi:anthrone oxygenase family protein [Dactylosporangium cerinum]|uniref:Anthrone oxygenase family protein n=1 Tax=Dactylosporangium cerinum TaxID=1434730 RepID=A0ABV9WFA8_9ACTN
MLGIVRVASTLLLGLYAGGVFFAVIAPSLGRLPGPAYVRYWQALSTDYGRAMPPLLLACVVLLLATGVLSFGRGRLVFGLTVGVLLLVVATIVLTVTQLEPLNRLADAWDADRLPADWTAARDRWLTLHAVRTAVAVVAFVALLAAQAVDAGRPAGIGASNGAGAGRTVGP